MFILFFSAIFDILIINNAKFNDHKIRFFEIIYKFNYFENFYLNIITTYELYYLLKYCIVYYIYKKITTYFRFINISDIQNVLSSEYRKFLNK